MQFIKSQLVQVPFTAHELLHIKFEDDWELWSWLDQESWNYDGRSKSEGESRKATFCLSPGFNWSEYPTAIFMSKI